MIRSCGSPHRFGQRRALERALDHRRHGDVARVGRVRAAGVRVHHLGEQVLVERAPVDADPNRLVVGERHLDDRPEVLVVALAADVARVDAVLGERARAVGKPGEQQVAVVVEIADDRDADAEPVETLDDRRYRGGRLVVVDRHPHQLAAGAGQRRDLTHGGRHVGGIRVGHRLDDDRVTGAHEHAADAGGHGLAGASREAWREYNLARSSRSR